MPKQLSTAEMRRWLIKDGSGIELLSDYTGSLTKATFKCQHDHTWEATPNNIKKGRGCPVCYGKLPINSTRVRPSKVTAGKNTRLNESTVNARIYERGIKIIGKYINNSTKTKFGCSHGHTWMASPSNILQGRGCPDCREDSRTLSVDKKTTRKNQLNEWLIENNREINLVGDYVANKTKTLFGCSFGHQWLGRIDHVKSGVGCPTCADYGFKPNAPAWEYGFIRNGYLKIGITNNINQRLKKHKRHGDFELVHKRYHEIGQHALDWENDIKKNYGGSYVTKEECPEGYTETFPIDLLKVIHHEHPRP